jgi:hypothetical protein
VRAPVLRREPGGLRDVFGDDRSFERHGGGVAVDGRYGSGDVGVRDTCVCANAPRLRGVVVEPDRVAVGRERAAGQRDHVREHGLDVE